jgi:hypothetical protein
MRRKIRVTILTPLITVLAAAALYAPQASAVAYCALRDPAAAIQQLFPGRTTYRTFVETIGRNIRPTLAAKLPFDIHFDEFGRHSFYAIFRDERPEGFVQARSELGQWGLAEIVWALDLDLKILDFVFQRNRDPAARYVEASDFKDILRGRGVDELAALLAQVELGQPAELGLPEKAVPLARTVIESAMKVIVVTGTVWEEDIKRVRALAAKAGEFSDLDHAAVKYGPCKAAPPGRPEGSVLPESRVFDKDDGRALSVIDLRGDLLGSVVDPMYDTRFSRQSRRWAVTDEQIFKSINSQVGWSEFEASALIGSLDRMTEGLSHSGTSEVPALAETMLVAGMPSP